MNGNAIIKRLLRKKGYNVNRILPSTDAWARRNVLFAAKQIDLVLDIGAHVGGYGRSLRESGYSGAILSFEPQDTVLKELRNAAEKMPPWNVREVAISNFDGSATFYLEERSSSSSLMLMDEDARKMAQSRMIDSRAVQVNRLDTILDEILCMGSNIYLKCDAQGAEKSIFEGAQRTIRNVAAVEIELSLGGMYSGQWNFREALDYFFLEGFELFSLEAGFADAVTGKVMQVDAIFTRC